MAAASGIAVHLALYLDLMLVFGVPAFALYSLPGPGFAARLPLRRLVAAAAGIGLALSAIGIAILAAAMRGVPLAAVDWPSIHMLVTGTAAGTAWLVRVVALLAVAALAMLARRRRQWLAVVAGGGVALASLAWQGHGAMDEGATGAIHLAADIGHLLAAGIWVGALAGLVLLLFRPPERREPGHVAACHHALAGFATIGAFIVAVIVATGLVNAWLLVGPGPARSLGDSRYGRLLLAKLALFAAMLGLAARNRFQLTPALAAGDSRAALAALRSSLAIEVSLAVAILALVAWLGTLEPPA